MGAACQRIENLKATYESTPEVINDPSSVGKTEGRWADRECCERVFVSGLYLAAYKAFSQTSGLSFTSTSTVGRYHLLLQMRTLR